MNIAVKIATSLTALTILTLSLGTVGHADAFDGARAPLKEKLPDTIVNGGGTNPTLSSQSLQANTTTTQPCQFSWTPNQNNVAEVDMQTNTTSIPPSVMWAYELTPTGQALFDYGLVTVGLMDTSVTTVGGSYIPVNAGYWYAPHQGSSYLWHGSMSGYQYQNSSLTASLQHGDTINMTIYARGNNADGDIVTDYTYVTCQVP